MTPADLPPGPTVLVIGHPGHELRVHHWLEIVRPEVLVLTDGSGHHPTGRLASTERILRSAGAVPGPVFGYLADRDVYDALIRGDMQPWFDLMDRLAERFVTTGVRCVVADAAEGFNPTHDLCRYVVDAAVTRATLLGADIRALEFDLDASPENAEGGPGVRLDLTPDALARKMAAARSYVELEDEVDAALDRYGEAAFAAETLRDAHSGRRQWSALSPPYYECVGRQRVSRGTYATVITHAHLALVQQGLLARAGAPR